MVLKIETLSYKLEEIKDKCLVIAFFEDNLKLGNDLMNLDKAIGNTISNSIKNKDFKAEENEAKTLYVNNGKLRYVALLGLGKEDKFNLKKLMDNVGNLSRQLRSLGIDSFSVYLDSFKNKKFEFDSYLQKIVIALDLSLYQYLEYKTKDLDKIKKIEKIEKKIALLIARSGH